MPFKSEAQRRLCWLLYKRDQAAKRKPRWDCKSWSKHTPKGKLPYHVRKSRKSVRKSVRKSRRSVRKSVRKPRRSVRKSVRSRR